MNDRLIHDAAFACATHLLEVFAHLLREEEKDDAFGELYSAVRAAIEGYELQLGHLRDRLAPTDN